MSYLIIAALGLGLAFALKKLRVHRLEVRDLHQAVVEKRPVVGEEGGSRSRPDDWGRLCAATNALIAEIAQVQRLQTGQLEQLDATLGSLQEAVLLVDSENRILLANGALQAIFPRAKDVLNQRIELVLHSAAFLHYVGDMRASRAGPQREIEFVEGGKSVWLEVTGTLVAPLAGGHGSPALFVLHDITKQKELEGIRKDFVANVSHELRTPLSIIKGYIETLVDGHRTMTIEDRDRFLLTVQRHTERLNSLLEDLLTLSHLESANPELRWESTPLAELLVGLVDDVRERASTTGHLFSCAVDPAIGRVLMDPLKISQVCANLLDNALKYTPPGAHIEVSARRRENEIEVCVRDNGPGIPPADLPRIFERFYRVDKGRSRERGGTGLGLSIVKHIVQLHGGQVWAESELGRGTSFYFTLPQRES